MAHHHCDTSSKKAVLPGRDNAEMVLPTHYMLRCSAVSVYNERFDLKISLHELVEYLFVSVSSKSTKNLQSSSSFAETQK